EVSAVVARRAPTHSAEIIGLPYGMDLPIVADLDLYERAARLTSETGQHVFDTLYHDVALSRPAAAPITADECYCRAAGRAGRLIRLARFPLMLAYCPLSRMSSCDGNGTSGIVSSAASATRGSTPRRVR